MDTALANAQVEGASVANTVHCDYNLPLMKKLLLVFALLLFPFQVSWAVMDTYCQQAQGVSHFQCLEYTSQPRADVQIDQEKDGLSEVHSDLDCSSCAVQNPAIVSLHLNVFPSAPIAFQRHVESRFLRSAIAERPERPQWPTIPA